MDIKRLTIRELNEGLFSNKFSCEEVVRDYLRNIEGKDGDIGAYLSIDSTQALESARRIDEDISKGNQSNALLTGAPIAIKDNILIDGKQATAASQILKNYKAAYSATVIKKLGNAGAIFLGKTNMDEFAMGSSTENSSFRETRNPHDLTRVPGGSSGGSAAAVASGMAIGALGSDTGGSIRQPASLCGVVGLKPTYGAVSRYGIIAMASSLDQIGPIAKTVDDAAIIFKTIAGQDPMDATSVDAGYGDEILNPDPSNLKKLVIGVPREYFSGGLDKETSMAMEKAMSDLKKLGFKFKEISLPHSRYALSVYYIIMPAEVSTNLARFDGIRYGHREKAKNLLDLYYQNKEMGLGPETKRRIILGTFVLSAGYYDAYYAKAQRVRALIKKDFDKVFDSGIDVIFSPVSPTVAFKLGEKTSDPLQMYLSDIFTIPANLAGLPGISIPVRGASNKLPVGFQLIGKKWREVDILGIGRIYENL